MLDLCIIGAPKSGTSSLFRWLTAHPKIAGPENGKELFFFMDPEHPLTKEPNVHDTSLVTYETLFPDSADRKVEGTTHYLFQDTARKYLGQMDSQPLIVAILREPAQRVWSSFRYTQNNLARMDPSLSFAQYVEWALNEERERIVDFISHPGSAYVLARDIDYSKYVKHLIPWREAIGSERLLLIEFSKLVDRSRSTCRQLADALGVDYHFYDDYEFKEQNSTYKTKFSLLHFWARRVEQWIPDGSIKKYIKQSYMTTATRGRSSISEENEQALYRLREYYRPHNRRLSQEFDVDISSWS